jgi:hypothetical protein
VTNLYAQGLLDGPAALVLALLVGVGFGFWLERAGFGSARTLTGLFYFRDFTVFHVMFTAMVTGIVGLELLGAAGLVDATTLYRPETFLGPQVVGGLIFGVGFVAGGWCPGTAFVGLASGKLDALVFLVGAGIGSLVFAAAYPGLGGFPTAGACGVVTLPETFGISEGAVVLAVLAMAFGGFAAIAKWGPRAPREA